MEIKKQTKKQFEMLHGDKDKQSRTAKACYDVLFNNVQRGTASKEHGITEQSIGVFIRTNEHKHSERYLYVEKGNVNEEV